MTTDEKIAAAEKRIGELQLLIKHWRKDQWIDEVKTEVTEITASLMKNG
jgi:DNA polymerase sigma